MEPVEISSQPTDEKLTAALATEKKHTIKDRIYRDMDIYQLFQREPKSAEKQSGMSQEENMQMMVLKYEEALNEPYKIKANREFLML